MPDIPQKVQVLCIGGGPGGSYAACCLAREGYEVLVLEADKFPRYHVGESMLLSMRYFLRFIDLEKDFDAYGFQHKPGGAFKLNPTRPEGYTNYIANSPDDYSWNVVRSESDNLIFKHAEKLGALIFDGTKVTDLEFEDHDGKILITGAKWENLDGKTGHVTCDWVIDASGRNGLISAKYLKTRKFNESLRNIAFWGYWRGCGSYMPDSPRAGAVFAEALIDESGWVWFIPLHNGTTSIGVVMNQAIFVDKKSKLSADKSTMNFYLQELKRAPTVLGFIGSGSLITDGYKPSIKQASDFSYSASSYSGPNYRIVGDAGAFLDPFFSSGVHLAIAGGLAAAASIGSVLKGEYDNIEASEWYSARVSTSYTRFLLVVLSAYRQMQAQTEPILADVDEASFDRAFGHFREIIQGLVDTQKKLSQDELRRTVEFCAVAFAPLDGGSNSAQNNHEARNVLRTRDTLQIDDFLADSFNGLHIRLKRGDLGLERE